MTDKKLTDEDVVEGLERCISTTTAEACEGCPFNKQNLCNKDQWALERYSLDLIKRQKSEIERLKECPKCVYEYDGEVIEYCIQGPCPNFKTVEQIKVEAYKEFAEALRKHYDNPVWYLGGSNGFFDNLDSLVKEMIGEEE